MSLSFILFLFFSIILIDKGFDLNNELIDIYINGYSSKNRLGKYSAFFINRDDRIIDFLSSSVKPVKDGFFDLFRDSLDCELAYPSFVKYLKRCHFSAYSLYLQRLAFYRSISLLIEILNVNDFYSVKEVYSKLISLNKLKVYGRGGKFLSFDFFIEMILKNYDLLEEQVNREILFSVLDVDINSLNNKEESKKMFLSGVYPLIKDITVDYPYIYYFRFDYNKHDLFLAFNSGSISLGSFFIYKDEHTDLFSLFQMVSSGLKLVTDEFDKKFDGDFEELLLVSDSNCSELL